MNMTLALIDGPPPGLSFTVDATSVIATIILLLLGVVAYFGREWAHSVRTELGSIHTDMKEHNDRSDSTHQNYERRISKIEGKLED